MDSISQHIALSAEQGLQINIWPCESGYQANVKERAGKGWTCFTDPDPLHALSNALRLRFSGARGRIVGDGTPAQQIDIEEAIAATTVDQVVPRTTDDEIEALLG